MINYYLERILYILLGFLLSFILPILLTYYFNRKNQELYIDPDSIYLNLTLPGSQWFNMGFWSTTTNNDDSESNEDFTTAASNLARKLIKKSGLKEGDKVIEVGYGNGDSIKLLVEEFNPSEIIGFTSLENQLINASKRIASLPTAIRERTSIDLRVGDAATVLLTLPPSSADHVLALDCAYHFKTRQSFIESSHQVLKPDGTLSLTDLILTSPPSFIDSILLKIIFYLAKVPSTNIVTSSEYQERLKPFYTDITLEDISKNVYPGFLNFLDRRDKEMGETIFGKNWKGLMWYGRIVRWYSGGGGGKQRLSFILVTGKKKDLDKKVEMKVY